MEPLIFLSLPPIPALLSPSCIPKIRQSRWRANATNLPMVSSPPQSPRYVKHPQLETLKDRLIRAAERGSIDDAFTFLDLMDSQGVGADLVIYSTLLKSCIRRRDLARGEIVRRRLTQSGLEPDSVLRNSLIALYSKCGEWERAREVFEEMGNKRDLVSWSSMISACANNGMNYRAVGMFTKMMELGFRPNEFCFSAVFRACCFDPEMIQVGLVAFGMSIKTGYFGADVCVGCALIDMFAKVKDLVSARKIFEQMPDRNLVTWTLLITRCAQHGLADDAVELFLDLLLDGEFEPDQFTMSSVISACTELGSPSRFGQQLHALAIRLGFTQDVCVGCALVDMYAKSAMQRSMENSRKVFDRMTKHNVMSWTAIITGYAQVGGQDVEAINLFSDMINGSIKPNHFTFSSLLKACANLSDADAGKQVHAHVVKSGLASVNCVGNALVSMYSRSGRMEEARIAFDSLFEKNLISYNTIVDAYVKNSNTEEAFEMLQTIENSELGISAFTYASLLSAAASIGSMGKGQQLHCQVVKTGMRADQGVSNALVSMYSRCGNIEDAWLAFREMRTRNLISWTAMIAGSAKFGYANRALDLFHEMVGDGITPNDVTYVAVLSACSHAGLVKEGWEYFHSMSRDHGIAPKLDHYACMVDLLGRAGSLEEALRFIGSMPIKADALIWRTLLGACRVHRNLLMGEMAARKILELEPQDPAAHVLLSNLYAANGQWEGVTEIRRNMKQRDLIKEAGTSWMEVDSVIHKFFVGDSRHPCAEEIYIKLDELAADIKKIGYVPDLNFVLHEVEDELKEQYLFQHSEKLAVAYGLISTSAPKPIRVFKNLRVCGDCHNAIKLMSKVTGRVVILRDASRFHCMKDGICSCGEYW